VPVETAQTETQAELSLVDQVDPEATVSDIVEERENEAITEITLIKKDKPAEPKVTKEPQLIIDNNEIVLFDTTNESVTPETPVKHSIPKVEVFAKDTSNNGGLRISRTVGEFHKWTDSSSGSDTKDFHEKDMDKKSEERVRRLKEMSLKFDRPDDLEQIELVPAYKRKNVVLNQVTPSSESVISRFSLSDDIDEKPAIRNNENTFLHNKPD